MLIGIEFLEGYKNVNNFNILESGWVVRSGIFTLYFTLVPSVY